MSDSMDCSQGERICSSESFDTIRHLVSPDPETLHLTLLTPEVKVIGRCSSGTSNPRLSLCFKLKAWHSVRLTREMNADRSAAYGVAGSGKFKTTEEIAKRDQAKTWRYGQAPTEEDRALSAALEEVGNELPGNPGPVAVAQAWAMSKRPYVFPVIGGTDPEQLKANIEVSLHRFHYLFELSPV